MKIKFFIVLILITITISAKVVEYQTITKEVIVSVNCTIEQDKVLLIWKMENISDNSIFISRRYYRDSKLEFDLSLLNGSFPLSSTSGYMRDYGMSRVYELKSGESRTHSIQCRIDESVADKTYQFYFDYFLESPELRNFVNSDSGVGSPIFYRENEDLWSLTDLFQPLHKGGSVSVDLEILEDF